MFADEPKGDVVDDGSGSAAEDGEGEVEQVGFVAFGRGAGRGFMRGRQSSHRNCASKNSLTAVVARG